MVLHIVIGPMWSGKTFHCIRLSRRYRAIGMKVLFIDHIIDNRYSKDQTHVISHDGDKEESIFTDSLNKMNILPEYQDADVVIIEEAQFFPDLLQFVTREIGCTKKNFIVSGLSGDYQMKPIGDILYLIPYAEYVEKLNGLCHICKNGNIGAFTKRKKIEIETQILVGEKDIYECVCREHL